MRTRVARALNSLGVCVLAGPTVGQGAGVVLWRCLGTREAKVGDQHENRLLALGMLSVSEVQGVPKRLLELF